MSVHLVKIEGFFKGVWKTSVKGKVWGWGPLVITRYNDIKTGKILQCIYLNVSYIKNTDRRKYIVFQKH